MDVVLSADYLESLYALIEERDGHLIWHGWMNGSKPYCRVPSRISSTTSTARMLWFAQRGPIPPGIQLKRSCDEPRCVAVEHHYLSTLEVRFWRRVRKASGNACWEWLGARTNAGYGHFSSTKRGMDAHRLAWTLTYGEIPAGIWLHHKCNNKLCVRPDHLELVTPKTNARRAVQDGLIPVGERHYHSRLTSDQVTELRWRHSVNNESARLLASEYGITVSHLHSVVSGRCWRHLPFPVEGVSLAAAADD